MNNFKDREKAYEAKFAQDQEMRFKISARRNKLLGLWLAEKLGKTGEAADAYAKEVIISDMEEAGDEDVIRKVTKDIENGGLSMSRAVIEEKLSEFAVIAADQLDTGSE